MLKAMLVPSGATQNSISCSIGGGAGDAGGRRCRRRRLGADVSDELVTAPEDGADHFLARAVVVDGSASRLDPAGKR